MSKIAIQIRDLGKSYIISHKAQSGSSYLALRDVLAEKVKKLITAKSWFLKAMKNEEFWALNNINIDVQKGDKVAIIGHNGAGKSTLLKILSQITEPTKGEVRINGRVSSLLEVGTGFHPELTGRENIYLNGSILGMTHAEVKRKFDEIVTFAGVEKFLDTPVKRYSSGMRMRLGFAVAAHLESEILIIDEVLAVGDAEFQKKCLGKMDDISKSEGRTILFVSHNMGAVQQLCNKGIVLNKGEVVYEGNTANAIQHYMQKTKKYLSQKITPERNLYPKGSILFTDYKIQDKNQKEINELIIGNQSSIELTIQVNEAIPALRTGISIKNNFGTTLVRFVEEDILIKPHMVGKKVKLICTFDNIFSPGEYSVDVNIKSANDMINKVTGLPLSIGSILNNGKKEIQLAVTQMPSKFNIKIE